MNSQCHTIGLISDTHIAFPGETLPYQVKDAFNGVDLILHAGDIWIPSVLDALADVAPVMAAWGDDDMEADLGDDTRMMKERVLTINGVTIWLTHVRPRYTQMNPKGNSSASEPDTEDSPDVVVFGHTHYAKIEYYNDILLVNPGSPTVPNYVPKLGTVALLTFNSGGVEARIVPLG